jgi:hypothetical protein
MIEPLFVDGIPARITVYDFRRSHLQSFPDLADSGYDNLLAEAIEAAYAMFPGVGKLWDWQPEQVWYDKTVLCYRLITAWYIADIYPALAAGVSVMGGIPLKRKKVDGVDITYADYLKGDERDLLRSLKSNPWGMKAHTMITTAAKRALLRNRRFT